jgi:3D (Asp-Asp-Asp) domain-containing protein
MPAFTGTETAFAIWHKPFLLYGGTMFKILRVYALIVVLGFGSVLAQSDDGTVLSPNLPLPNPLHFLPIGNKPQPQPAPSSAQPAPPPTPVVAAPTPRPVPNPPQPSTTPTTSSVPITAPRPALEPVKPEAIQKPVELPSSLILPIPSNIRVPKPVATPKPAVVVPKPVTATPQATTPSSKPAVALIPKPAPKPVTVAPKPAPKPATVTRTTSSRALLTLVAKSTAYNSIPNQTDSTPFVTATGARTRFGVVALSRDLLRRIPYGSIVRIEDMGSWTNGRGRGTYNRMLSGVNFIVEDTMHPRKRNTVDVWMPTRRAAIQWGARQIRVTVIRLGRR